MIYLISLLIMGIVAIGSLFFIFKDTNNIHSKV